MCFCRHNYKKDTAQNSFNVIAAEKQEETTIDTLLKEGIVRLLNTQEHEKYDSIPISESCIILRSIISKDDSIVYFSDSTINITYNFTYFKDNNYKGCLHINRVNVAIFDAGDFLDKYYNADSLKKIPFNCFKQYPMETILTNTYYIKNGKIKFWNP